MENEKLKKLIDENKKTAKGKSSADCTLLERIEVYRQSIPKKETPKQRLDRINAFRCGW